MRTEAATADNAGMHTTWEAGPKAREQAAEVCCATAAGRRNIGMHEGTPFLSILLQQPLVNPATGPNQLLGCTAACARLTGAHQSGRLLLHHQRTA